MELHYELGDAGWLCNFAYIEILYIIFKCRIYLGNKVKIIENNSIIKYN